MAVIKNDTINRIRNLIDKKYAKLSIMVLGRENVTESQRSLQPKMDGEPILEKVYYHNYLNEENAKGAPKNVAEMISQQSMAGALPLGEAHTISVNYLNSNLLQLIEKHKAEVTSRLIGIIRDSNNRYKNNALTDLDRPEQMDSLVKQSTVQQLKRKLRDYTHDANRNWNRIAVTEISNAVGMGSADHIIAQNKDSKDAEDIYTYRINPNDGATCKYCRAFYIDFDGSPKVYRMSTILNNGSNYGVKAPSWKPVAGATHPNCFTEKNVKVLSKNGWKSMWNLHIGEEVLTHTGKFRKVTGKIEAEYKNKEAYEIKFNYNDRTQKIRVTPDHKFLTDKGWVEAQNLSKRNKFIRLKVPCAVCEKEVKFKSSKTFDLAATCSKNCFKKLMKKQALKQHSTMSEEDKLKRNSACSDGTKKAYDEGRLVSPFSGNYWTKEKREEQRFKLNSRLPEMMKKSAGTRISKKQKLAFGWLLSFFPKDKIELEYQVGNYFIDIAFPNKKIAVEIDGIYHDDERRKKDNERDHWLQNQGWIVLRFGFNCEKEVTKSNILEDLSRIMFNHNEKYDFEETEIISIRKTRTCDTNGKIYCIQVDKDESFITRGIVSHNCRDSQLIELKPGWKVQSGGAVTWIGLDKWKDYIKDKVTE